MMQDAIYFTLNTDIGPLKSVMYIDHPMDKKAVKDGLFAMLGELNDKHSGIQLDIDLNKLVLKIECELYTKSVVDS